MVKCCAPLCNSATYRKTPEITFHRFPKDEYLKNIWIKNINRKDWKPSPSSVLCSNHFTAGLVDNSGFRAVLSPGAIPTLFIETSEENKENVFCPLNVTLRRKRSSTGDLLLSELQKSDLGTLNPQNVPSTSMVIKTPKVQPSTSTVTLATSSGAEMILDQPGPSFASPQLPKNSETDIVEKLKKRVMTKNKKIKCLQERNRRMKKKIQKFTDVITELKKQLNKEEMHILSNISVKNKDFMVRYLKKTQNKTLEKSYPPEVRAFALQLNFFSPRAYNFVRNYFNTVLPHRNTISLWYKKMNAQPGFTSESFQTLESLSKNSKHKLFINLCVDEMAIRKEQVWDISNNKFKGHVDTGTGVSDDSLPLATQALVIMATALNACWKLPIAYFFIVSMSGEQRANIVKMAIEMLFNINVFVSGLTFDGAASNISMATNLGCSFDVNNLKSFFYYKNMKIYAFYDPCHMLKLIRNCLGDLNVLIDKDGNYVKFEYLSLLQKLTEEKGLHLGIKIRKAHIHFAKQKMKVRLAAQLFSKSVADALSFCKNILKLKQFEGCAATINFVDLVNDCFDILNSRTTLAPGNKKALCTANINIVKDFVHKATQYFFNLKLIDGRSVVHSTRKTGFVGFIICLNNVLNLYKDLLGSGGIQYLCTYKINQDHLEMFFGKMRSRGGFNDNPNVVQFQTAYKKNLICTELKLREKGILNDSSILNVSSTKTIEIINNNTPTNEISNMEMTDFNEENNYLFIHDILKLPLDEYSTHVLTYIAGFISRRILKKLKCLECQQLLIGDKADFLLSLINVKDRGGLTYPSMAVINIVKMCENYLKIENKTISYEKFMMYFIKDTNNLDFFRSSNINHDSQHLYLLLKSVVKLFLDIRLNYVSKSDLMSERNYLKKTVLFKNK